MCKMNKDYQQQSFHGFKSVTVTVLLKTNDRQHLQIVITIPFCPLNADNISASPSLRIKQRLWRLRSLELLWASVCAERTHSEQLPTHSSTGELDHQEIWNKIAGPESLPSPTCSTSQLLQCWTKVTSYCLGNALQGSRRPPAVTRPSFS
eukprot:5143792-Amphidinium_carterae.1